jgi:hypothetical protein
MRAVCHAANNVSQITPPRGCGTPSRRRRSPRYLQRLGRTHARQTTLWIYIRAIAQPQRQDAFVAQHFLGEEVVAQHSAPRLPAFQTCKQKTRRDCSRRATLPHKP